MKPTSAEEGFIPAAVRASRTFSIASGGVVTSQAAPSSRKSSAPASSTMPIILSSSAASLGTTMSPLRSNIQPTAPVSAMFRKHMANFAHDSIAVTGHHLNQQAHAARTVTFKRHLIQGLAFQIAGAALNRAFDIVVGHVFALGRQNGCSQARISIRISSAGTGRDGQFANYLSENLATAGVRGRLLMFNCCPF